MSEKGLISNVFIVNQEKLKEAIFLALSTIADIDPEVAKEWAEKYLYSFALKERRVNET